MRPIDHCLLYGFVDTAYLRGRPADLLARQLCEGGADLIQLRAKDRPLEEVRRLAAQLQPITEQAGVGLVINDYPTVAREVGAPLCHLGQEDFFDAGYTHVTQLLGGRSSLPAAVQVNREGTRMHAISTLGPRAESAPPQLDSRPLAFIRGSRPEESPLLFGLSTHAPAQAERALAAGPAYVAIGPVFATGTKPTAAPVTLEYVRWAAAHVSIPWFAIGGITLDNLDAVLAAGARRVCVVSAILGAPDLVRACQAFKNRLNRFAP